MPANVAAALGKLLKPRAGLVILLTALWSCSMRLLRYLTCLICILQSLDKGSFVFSSPAKLAPLLLLLTFSGSPLSVLSYETAFQEEENT